MFNVPGTAPPPVQGYRSHLECTNRWAGLDRASVVKLRLAVQENQCLTFHWSTCDCWSLTRVVQSSSELLAVVAVTEEHLPSSGSSLTTGVVKHRDLERFLAEAATFCGAALDYGGMTGDLLRRPSVFGVSGMESVSPYLDRSPPIREFGVRPMLEFSTESGADAVVIARDPAVVTSRS